ncbi:adenylate/guanylate cyclase domain-containing protein [Mycobacterium sp. 1164985.4]|uniref:adenylate/guanylate cyclase domain-containing protein n=1 Tax=Mycobacterium sp. 1164985.4 TaxID=1834069 RepID=UPI0007FCF56F|nr:adenylate/guanylate cyclase domain-containing protein [Mycobacterium sp. 1164985.4]OBK75724.1 cyclase [Mycobacterium sp. 1164985.4]
MDRIWQWAWDRFAPQYTWLMCAISLPLLLPIWLFASFIVVAFEHSDRYAQGGAVTLVAVLVLLYILILPGMGDSRYLEKWAAGQDVDRMVALTASYTWARRTIVRALVANPIWAAVLLVVIGAFNDAPASRLVQYGILGFVLGALVQLIGVHSVVEGSMRPPRAAIADESGAGDSLPRSRPTFATWSSVSMLAVAFIFAIAGAVLAAVLGNVSELPAMAVAIGCAMTIGFAVPITVGSAFAPSLQPVRDLARGTERIAAGHYTQRLPVVQDDDLGALAASFNRMQAGLAERQRLHAAFGTYVDPTLAARLLEQGDDVFTGERREVTVMFVDIRDFTPFAEARPAEEVVGRLNALFGIVVPAVVDAGGHVNKFLGDGALAVFGAPNDLVSHADAALEAAVLIQRLVAERFGGEVRIGIGINTGTVIAGTIGGGTKLEFTLIGDTVNVAARVEQLTKATADTILLTDRTVASLVSRPPRLVDRGLHAVKGKSAEVRVFCLGLSTPTG